MKEQKVYVAIVTYNRKEYLLNLLEALQQSEKKISGILLLDNKSTDGTNQTLMEIGFTEKDDIGVLHENTWKSMKTYYFRNTENAGGAGGFAKLFELSMSGDGRRCISGTGLSDQFAEIHWKRCRGLYPIKK